MSQYKFCTGPTNLLDLAGLNFNGSPENLSDKGILYVGGGKRTETKAKARVKGVEIESEERGGTRTVHTNTSDKGGNATPREDVRRMLGGC
ncbi:hypothetical protein RRG08_057080 [Elysia crispata]|uniref:Uncharacterized protein n=1 Tax=Elysia crispata TaxID=231223 RepID=A0AAE1ALW8_9GAST|nr:hypothetical protein RRG08_057080 [Elysia crispata]